MAAGPRRRPELLTRKVEGEVVVLDQVSGTVHHLNATASLIWEECAGQKTTDEIAARLAEEVGKTPQEVMADVARTIASFRQLGLLVEDKED